MIEISQIRLSLNACRTEKSCLAALKGQVLRILGCKPEDVVGIELHRRSVDARKRSDVHFIASARVELADEDRVLAGLSPAAAKRVRRVAESGVSFPERLHKREEWRPVVVGAGCAGLFCALALAEAGLEPVLIERGDASRERTERIGVFERTGELDPESNIQFGLGGAGTFSDGKLTTGTKNPAHRLILETFVQAGAPREILWEAKPHIGSDILPHVVEHIVRRIGELGGEVRFRARLTRIERGPSGGVSGVRFVQEGRERRMLCSRLVLATGHSARDVFEMLERDGFALARKTFAMGVRIEHLQRDIDRALFGRAAGHPALGAASYKLVAHLEGGRSLFSFCMCPGGQVVAAASEQGGVVTNGASLFARDGRNANAALLVNVTPEDLPGASPLAGVELQRACERAAFQAGGGRYRAPAQLVGDFLACRPSDGACRVEPTYPLGVAWTELDDLLPDHVVATLRAGIPALDRKLHGFANPEAVLTGVETRSSSPVTVVRDGGCRGVGVPGFYPCGEGAGYAGGIMSAATDGLRCANAVIEDVATAARTYPVADKPHARR